MPERPSAFPKTIANNSPFVLELWRMSEQVAELAEQKSSGLERASWRSALLLFLLFILFRIIVPFIPVPSTWGYQVNAFIISPLFVCLNIALVYQLAKFKWTIKSALGIMLIAAVPFALSLWAQFKVTEPERQYAAIIEQAEMTLMANNITAAYIAPATRDLPDYASTLPVFMLLNMPPNVPPPPPENALPKLVIDVLGKLSLLVLLVSFGALVSFIIRERNLLVPVAPVAGVFDIFTVLTPKGFTYQMIQQRPEIIPMVSVTVPTVNVAQQAVRPIGEPFAIIGPGDILFLGFYFVCLAKFGMKLKTTAIAMCIALVLYLEVVLNFGNMRLFGLSLDALPALVPMAAVVLLINWREFNLSAQEKLQSAIVWITIISLIIGFYWVSRT